MALQSGVKFVTGVI